MLSDTEHTAAWPRSRESESKALLAAMIDRLCRLGFEVPELCGPGKNVAGGVPLTLSLRGPQPARAAFAAGIERIVGIMQMQLPVTVSLEDFGHGERAILNLQRLCEALVRAIAVNNLPGDQLGLCIAAQHFPLQTFQSLADTLPGNGPRYVRLGGADMTPSDGRRQPVDAHPVWSCLWKHRMAKSPTLPAYAALARTACPLLADESVATILPVAGVQVPSASAWLPISLPLPAFANENGEIQWDRLLPALGEGMALAERMLDVLEWPYDLQRADARLNRRLAWSLTGLGTLVVRRRCNPRDLASLNWLAAIVSRIRKTLWLHSANLARQNGALAALCDADPAHHWVDSARRDAWRRCWQAALDESAVRHRNLLVLSPYCVLTEGARATDGYTDLLPAIAYADAWSFANAPQFSDWSQRDYVGFHRRAWAVMQHPKTAPVIAAGYDLR
jgi:hypothetical protein